MDLSENMHCWCCNDKIKLDRCALIQNPSSKRRGGKRHGLCDDCYTKTKRFLEKRRQLVFPTLRFHNRSKTGEILN